MTPLRWWIASGDCDSFGERTKREERGEERVLMSMKALFVEQSSPERQQAAATTLLLPFRRFPIL